MTFIQKPDNLCLSRNIPKVIVSSEDVFSFELKKGEDVLFSASYTPDKNNRAEIDIREIVHTSLSFTLKEQTTSYVQSNLVADFTISLNSGELTASFRAIRAGVDRSSVDAAIFLKANFLTWQPQVKKVTYSTPEYLTFYAVSDCVVRLKAYFNEGEETTSEEIELYNASAGSAYTLQMEYAVIAAKFDSRFPSFYDVWVEDTVGARLTYVQRYVASDILSEREHWILFENSLGGIDTIRAYGQCDFTADHTHNIAVIDEVSTEYSVDTERIFEKSTGFLTPQERTWLLDFLPSAQKYIFAGNALRPIVVTEDNTAYTEEDLPSEYTFSYKYADATPLLNITRAEELQEVLDIKVPDLGSFSIPPRLIEFPSLNLSEGALFPVQHPFSENWAVTTAGELYNYILSRIAANPESGTGGTGHTHANYSLLSALSLFQKYLLVNGEKINAGTADLANELSEELHARLLHKDKEDGTNFLLKFGEFIDSIIAGKGAGIYPDGRGQFEKLEVRSSMIVKELIYNRWFAQEGNVTYSEAGTIERIELLEDGTYDLYLRRRWDNDITAFSQQDVSYGSVNNLNTAGVYYDSWFRVLSVMQAENKINVVLYPDEEVPRGKNYPPASGMVITRRGNAVDEERQGFWYISSYEGCICMLDGVTKPVLEESNYSIIIGKLKRLELFDNLPINYRHSYVYCRGIAIQDLMRINYQGVVVVQLNDRGFWSLEVAQSENPYTAGEEMVDTVWHYGCRWKCLVTGTTDEPRYASTGWAMIEGNPAFSIDIESENGWAFDASQLQEGVVFTTLSVTGQLYNRDVTEHILDTDVSWTRDTGNVSEDNAWAIKRADAGKTLTLTPDDLGAEFGRTKMVCSFKATALLRDGQQTEIAEQTITF
jgi:hypothetical protein